MNKFKLFFMACLALVFYACDYGDTNEYFTLTNTTNKEVIVEYQYSETELRIVKVPAKESSYVWYVKYLSPDYTPDSSTIEEKLNKLTIYQVTGIDTTYLPKDEYISASKWVRNANYDMSTTTACYTLIVDSIMFTKK